MTSIDDIICVYHMPNALGGFKGFGNGLLSDGRPISFDEWKRARTDSDYDHYDACCEKLNWKAVNPLHRNFNKMDYFYKLQANKLDRNRGFEF